MAARLPYRRTIVPHQYFHEVGQVVQLMLIAALNFRFCRSRTLNQNAAPTGIYFDRLDQFPKI
jgi:hypothetical protein